MVLVWFCIICDVVLGVVLYWFWYGLVIVQFLMFRSPSEPPEMAYGLVGPDNGHGDQPETVGKLFGSLQVYRQDLSNRKL